MIHDYKAFGGDGGGLADIPHDVPAAVVWPNGETHKVYVRFTKLSPADEAREKHLAGGIVWVAREDVAKVVGNGED